MDTDTEDLRAPYKAAPVLCAATLLAVTASALGRPLFRPAAGTFVAALQPYKRNHLGDRRDFAFMVTETGSTCF
jgi:hypothetical protein